jgi:hypothetical protein
MWLFKKHPKNRASTQNLGLLSRHLFSDFTYERDHRKAAGFFTQPGPKGAGAFLHTPTLGV